LRGGPIDRIAVKRVGEVDDLGLAQIRLGHGAGRKGAKKE